MSSTTMQPLEVTLPDGKVKQVPLTHPPEVGHFAFVMPVFDAGVDKDDCDLLIPTRKHAIGYQAWGWNYRQQTWSRLGCVTDKRDAQGFARVHHCRCMIEYGCLVE
jgi:hypothetical protein